MINIIFILLFAIITTITIRILKISYSHHYFSLYQLIFSDDDPFTFWGLMIILMPTFLGSILVTLLFKELEYALFYGFLTAFLIIWPVIIYTRQLLPC